MRAYIHACAHACTHINLGAWLYASMRASMYTCIQAYSTLRTHVQNTGNPLPRRFTNIVKPASICAYAWTIHVQNIVNAESTMFKTCPNIAKPCPNMVHAWPSTATIYPTMVKQQPTLVGRTSVHPLPSPRPHLASQGMCLPDRYRSSCESMSGWRPLIPSHR